MRLISFMLNKVAQYGYVSDQGIHAVEDRVLADCPTLVAFLSQYPAEKLMSVCKAPIAAEQITWLPPIPDPSKIICAGMNYRKVYPVQGMPPPDPNNVIIFGRQPETLVAHMAPLEMPVGDAGQTFDFEGEIVAVIGKAGRHISKADAMDHVLGYSIMNEGSVRGWMKHSLHAGKNFHASGSWGPWITTQDAAGDFDALELETLVNGKQMQLTQASEMIFDLPTLISYTSAIMPLNVGDIIATGSPDGTGGSRTPPEFLTPGDVVTVKVSKIGALENKVGAPAI